MDDRIQLTKEEFDNLSVLVFQYKIILDRLLALDARLRVDPSLGYYYQTYFKALETIKTKI